MKKIFVSYIFDKELYPRYKELITQNHKDNPMLKWVNKRIFL